MGGPVDDLPIPFTGPPMLVDRKANFALAEMTAIVLYLAETLALLRAKPPLRAMTMKVVNDMIDGITLEGGRGMSLQPG